jgi:hypothetical protein
VFAILEHLHAVDKNVLHAGGILVRPVKRGMVLDGRRVKDDDVGIVPRRQRAPTLQLEVCGRQTGESPHCFFQRDNPFVAHVPPQQPGKGAIGAGVGAGLEEDPF